jgi:uncharacterized membrane protein YbhN (UPF0104 family)
MRTAGRARAGLDALKRRPWLLRTLEVLASAIVVALCVYGVRDVWGKAGPQLESANPWLFAAALGAVAAYYLVFILGWVRILASWEVFVPYRVALQAEMISMLAKYIPGGVWTPAARVAALNRLTGERRTATVVGSIFVEAILSAISGVLVFVVSLAWVHGVDAPIEPLIAFSLVCILVLHPRVFRWVTGRLRRFDIPALEPLPFGLMLTLLAFYCFTWLIGGAALYLLIRSVGFDPGLATIPFLGGTAAVGAIVATLAIFSPSGLGVREASMYGLLTAVTSDASALSATILNRLAITVVELALFLVGVLAWRMSRGQRIRVAAAERAAEGRV